MAATDELKASPARLATWRVIDAAMEAHIAGGEFGFPDGSAFIPADRATDKAIRRYHDEGRTVVVVDEHERVRVLPPPS